MSTRPQPSPPLTALLVIVMFFLILFANDVLAPCIWRLKRIDILAIQLVIYQPVERPATDLKFAFQPGRREFRLLLDQCTNPDVGYSTPVRPGSLLLTPLILADQRRT